VATLPNQVQGSLPADSRARSYYVDANVKSARVVEFWRKARHADPPLAPSFGLFRPRLTEVNRLCFVTHRIAAIFFLVGKYCSAHSNSMESEL